MRTFLVRILFLVQLFGVTAFAQNESDPSLSETITKKTEYRAILIGYWMSPKMKFDYNATGISSYGGTVEYSMKSSPVVGYEWSQFNQNSWNHGYQIDYTKVDFNTAIVTGGGAIASGSVNGSLSIVGLTYTGKYCWEKFYLPTGIGLSSSSVTGNDAAFTKTIRSVVGAWVGIGLHASEKLNLELVSKSYSVLGDMVTSGGFVISANTGYLAGLQLNAKILF